MALIFQISLPVPQLRHHSAISSEMWSTLCCDHWLFNYVIESCILLHHQDIGKSWSKTWMSLRFTLLPSICYIATCLLISNVHEAICQILDLVFLMLSSIGPLCWARDTLVKKHLLLGSSMRSARWKSWGRELLQLGWDWQGRRGWTGSLYPTSRKTCTETLTWLWWSLWKCSLNSSNTHFCNSFPVESIIAEMKYSHCLDQQIGHHWRWPWATPPSSWPPDYSERWRRETSGWRRLVPAWWSPWTWGRIGWILTSVEPSIRRWIKQKGLSIAG